VESLIHFHRQQGFTAGEVLRRGARRRGDELGGGGWLGGGGGWVVCGGGVWGGGVGVAENRIMLHRKAVDPLDLPGEGGRDSPLQVKRSGWEKKGGGGKYV